jgi:subtilisin
MLKLALIAHLLTLKAGGQLLERSLYRTLQDEETVRVVIGFQDEQSHTEFEARWNTDRSSSALQQVRYKRTIAVAMNIPMTQWADIENDPSVAYVEEDTKSYLFSERVPYGIVAVQGTDPAIPLPDPSNECFKICVIDTGLLVSHDDIPYTLGMSNIDGQEFNLPQGEFWYNPSEASSHGTHVTVSSFVSYYIHYQ